MLPILTNLKNSISSSLKKINNISHTSKNENDYQTKISFDSGINNFEFKDNENREHYNSQHQIKKKICCKKKSKSFTKNDKNNYYQDYMNKRLSIMTTRSEFYLNSPNDKEPLRHQDNEYIDENVNDLSKKKYRDASKSKRKSKNESVMAASSSTASLPVNFDSSDLNLTNKLTRSQRTKSTRLKSFSNFFKKFGLFGINKFYHKKITSYH
jgi:hypothetical protein